MTIPCTHQIALLRSAAPLLSHADLDEELLTLMYAVSALEWRCAEAERFRDEMIAQAWEQDAMVRASANVVEIRRWLKVATL